MVEADDSQAPFTDDLWAWTNGLLRATLSGAPIVGGDSGQVQVRLGTEELSVYGDVKGNRPTGVVSFELRVVLPYVGKVYLGDACMGELCGYINVPQVSPTTLEQEFEVQVKPYELTPQGHIERDLCDYEQRIVDAIEARSDAMRCKVRRLLQRVAAFYRLEDQDVDDQAEIWAAGEVASEETTTGRCKLTKELRMQCAPKKYKDFLQAASDGPCTVKVVDLSFCQLQDDDLDGITAALAGFNDVETLDLQYNELQDLSVQKLVVLLAGGGLPALKRLLLGNNKFESTGRTMLKGLAMLRKGLVVKHENELD